MNSLTKLAKEINQITGKVSQMQEEKLRLGNPEITTKEEELRIAEANLAKERDKLSRLEEEVKNKKATLGMTPDEKAKLEEIEKTIKALNNKVISLTEKKEKKQKELLAAQSEYEKDKARLQELELKLRDLRAKPVPTYSAGTRVITCPYCNTEIRCNAVPIPLFPYYKNFSCPNCGNIICKMPQGSSVKIEKEAPEEPMSLLQKILYLKGTKEFEIPVFGRVAIPGKKGKLEEDKEKIDTLTSELEKISNDLEIARNDLLDATSTKARIELEIRRAIALRESEYYAAKQRLEIEKRLVEQLENTVKLLRIEIEQAKLSAEAEAARRREELMKATEEERKRIAKEQRKIAEELERIIKGKAGIEREEYEKALLEAKRKMEEAYKAALEAAKEREKAAKEAALKESEELKKRIEAETLKKEITPPVVKPVAEKIAGLPLWAWLLIGGGGITTVALLARKKNRRNL